MDLSGKPERELATAKFTDLEIEDHGWLVLRGGFEYESGSFQGFGYFAHSSFLMRLMNAVGVSEFRKLNGTSCWVTHTFNDIIKVEPLHKKGGTPFVIAEWQEWMKHNDEKNASPSAMAGKR